MTPAKSGPTNVVVVDGSNIATEGRSMPSLTQLNEAVMAFTEEFPDATVTVVVDATFGHRIDKKELAEFDAAIAHNELVAPPAGAIGRGDAFVLSIANKVGARILSNDSFQEFHGDYPWLFDEGRLIGGKPVPFVGWVFVERLPVKGAISRKATRSARGGREREARPARRTASKEASLPMPVPTAPPPGGRRTRNDRREAVVVDPVDELAAPERAPAPPSGSGPVNDLLPFLDFVEHHPVGSSVNGVVESYSSHGAYISVGDLRGYVPLRLMGDPPPRSAREVMKLGDAVTLVVTSFAPARRSVDLSIPKVATVTEVLPTPGLEELAQAIERPARKRAARKARPVAEPVVEEPAPAEPAEPAPAKRSVARKQAPAKKAAAKKAPEKKAAAKKAAAKKAAAKKAVSKKAAGRKVVAEAVPAEAVAAEPVVAEPAPVEQAPARKARARKAATTRSEPTVVDGVPVEGAAGVERAPAKRTARKRSAGAVMDPVAEGV